MQLLETNQTVAPSPRKTGLRKTILRSGLVLIAVTLLALYVQRLLLPSAGLDQDDGVYLVTAKALATGQGYHIISLPKPIVQTKYPILFPALLAVVWKLFPAFPDNLLLLKLVPFLATLAWFALVYHFYRREGLIKPHAAVLTGILAIVPWVLFLSSTLLSETLFFTLTLATLLLIRRLESSPAYSHLLPVAAGALAGAATLTRVAGVALIAAGALALLLRTRKAAALFLVAALAVCLPWFAFAAHAASALASSPGLGAYYTAKNYSGWNVVSNFTPAQKVDIVLTNLAATIGSFGLMFEYYLAGVALLITAAVIAGFILDIRRSGVTVVHWFCLAYLGLTLLWAWGPIRFLVLLLPFLLLFILRLVLACAEKTRWVWLPTSALLLVLPMLGDDAYQFRQSAKTGAAPAPGATNQPTAKWYEYAQMAAWLRDHAPPGAIIAANLDPLFYLYTGHPGVRGFSADPYLLFYAPGRAADALGSVDDFVRGLKLQNVTVLVCTSETGFAERKALKKLTAQAASLYPSTFHLALQLPDPEYRVYLVDPARLPLVADLP